SLRRQSGETSAASTAPSVSVQAPAWPSVRLRSTTRTAVSRSKSVSATACSAAARDASATDEPLVRDPVRPVGSSAEQLVAALLVGLEVALEPRHLRIALEREHVRRDAVEEPAVVRDHDHAAGKRQQRVLE